jgi:putative ABC transport system substrate-binding protein
MVYGWQQAHFKRRRSLGEMESAFDSMAQAGVQAVALGPGGLLFQSRNSLQKLAVARGMPTCG